MNISVHKKTAGRAQTAALKKRIQNTLREKAEKTSKRIQSTKAETSRALQYARILSRMVQYDTTSHPYSEEHPASAQLERYHGYHRHALHVTVR